jgi:hypothetical protein
MTAKQINPREEVITNFDENILYDDEKIKDLANNLFNDTNYSDKTALTI